MVYLPSTAGQVGRAQTSLPICSTAFNCQYFRGTALLKVLPYMVGKRLFLFQWQAGRAAQSSFGLIYRKGLKSFTCNAAIWFSACWTASGTASFASALKKHSWHHLQHAMDITLQYFFILSLQPAKSKYKWYSWPVVHSQSQPTTKGDRALSFACNSLNILSSS